MVKRIIKYSSVYRKGRLMSGKEWRIKISNWYREYTTFIEETIIETKQYNHGRVINMRERILKWILFFVLKKYIKKRGINPL